jgi:hypothetical protein
LHAGQAKRIMIPLYDFPQLIREGKCHIPSATDQRSPFAEPVIIQLPAG